MEAPLFLPLLRMASNQISWPRRVAGTWGECFEGRAGADLRHWLASHGINRQLSSRLGAAARTRTDLAHQPAHSAHQSNPGTPGPWCSGGVGLSHPEVRVIAKVCGNPWVVDKCASGTSFCPFTGAAWRVLAEQLCQLVDARHAFSLLCVVENLNRLSRGSGFDPFLLLVGPTSSVLGAPRAAPDLFDLAGYGTQRALCVLVTFAPALLRVFEALCGLLS